VQVGDPFMEKLLLEACLELMQSDCLVGIQDMGAAGLTSSSVEMAARAGNGVELWLDKVPVRETHMTPYEIMLSESQERMLMVVTAGREAEALAVFDKWDLDAAVVGKVTGTGRVVVTMNGAVYADLPAEPLAEGLAYERPQTRPAYLDDAHAFDARTLPVPSDLGQALLRVLASPNVASKEWVYRQYDHNVRHGTVLRPGAADAGVVRVFSPDGAREKGVAISADCNARFVYLDPYEGARLAIGEAAANVVAVGAEPLAVTDCLNFGNPEKPEIMWQFAQAVRGLGDACRELSTPIVSGNVSLYNETDGKAIHPTPMIAMVGLMADVRQRVTQFFRGAGDVIALVGRNTAELGGSEFLKVVHGRVAGKPPRWAAESARRSNATVLALARAGLLRSAHDVSDGGLATCLAECCVSGPDSMGASVDLMDSDLRADELLFGEAPSRFVISCAASDWDRASAVAGAEGALLTRLGETGGSQFSLQLRREHISLAVVDLAAAYHGGFRATVE
jgi:phosphoribosylformylglycinamidine synthase